MTTANRTLLVTILLWALSAGAAMFVVYKDSSAEALQRIRAVEVQQDNDKDRLQRVEKKLDWLSLYLTGQRPAP